LIGGLLVAAALGQVRGEGAAAPPPSADEEERLRLLRRDIETLRKGIDTLTGREQGVLGELKALEADSLRKQIELADIEERINRTEKEAGELTVQSELLERRLGEMRGQLARRLGALYRLGRPRYLRVLLASDSPSELLSAYRTAAALSSRDARLMTTYREETTRARQEAARLAELRPILSREHERRRKAAAEVAAALQRKRAFLQVVHSDRLTHQEALSELEGAERSVRRLISGLPAPASPTIGFDRYRGLLDWPAPGSVSAPFGRSVNPRFGTALVHGGLDIDAPFGSAIRSVHDGTVVFAQWFRGYGLTIIVDHGGGWLSVYAHASALLVQKGEVVRRGQKVATVGDTASLRGPYLYFELRKDGRPVDPAGWLRPR
jgi:septal ring factor EnvC (AmiA/AmiB activator)